MVRYRSREELNDISENQVLKLTCKDFISVNHYMNYRSVKKGNFHMVMAYKPKATKDFEKSFGDYVKGEMIEQGWEKPTKDKFVNLDTIFYFPRVDMDAENYFKSMCDILTEVGVWEDDNIVMEKVNRIYYNSSNARIELLLTVSDNMGIFDNKEDYDKFTNTYCSKCKKGSKIGLKGGCSIYKDSLESRIRDEIPMATEEDRLNKVCLNIKLK